MNTFESHRVVLVVLVVLQNTMYVVSDNHAVYIVTCVVRRASTKWAQYIRSDIWAYVGQPKRLRPMLTLNAVVLHTRTKRPETFGYLIGSCHFLKHSARSAAGLPNTCASLHEHCVRNECHIVELAPHAGSTNVCGYVKNG